MSPRQVDHRNTLSTDLDKGGGKRDKLLIILATVDG